MITAKKVYEIQGQLQRLVEDKYDSETDTYLPLRYNEEISSLEADLEMMHKALGGKVYRVPAENVSTFESKVEKLNRKAAKLSCEPISLSDLETEEEVKKSQGKETLYVWHYMVVKGSAPMVPGYRFIAALDHTIQAKEGDPVIIKRVPGTDEDVDLSEYRTADARCDHCRQIRARNTTYLVQEAATGEISKVGSSCLRDFTGANDPEKVARYMEYLVEFDEQSTQMGEDYSSNGRRAYEVIEYLTHVAACIRVYGWAPRSMATPTADSAWDNIRNYGKRDERGRLMYVEVEDRDGETASKAREWAKGLKGKSEFDENLKVMAGLDYMPKKGDGIVAYIVQGYVKDETKRKEREAEEARNAEQTKNAQPATEGRQEVSGRVIKVYEKFSDYGSYWKMTLLDDRGFTVNGTIPSSIDDAKEGDRVTFTAKLEPKADDEYYAFYKRPTKAQILETVNA